MKNLICFFIVLLFQTSSAADIRLISIQANAEKSYTPDQVTISVNLWSKGKSAKEAQELNNIEFVKFKNSTDKFNIKSTDIHTDSYDLNPEYFYEPKTQKNRIISYQANQTIKVKIQKGEMAGKFIDSLTSNATNLVSGITVNNIHWDVEKRDSYEKDMLTEAIINGEALAQTIAKAAKVKIKNVFHITPQVNGGRVFRQENFAMAKSAMSDSMEVRPETTLLPGEIKIRSDVLIDYEIE